MNERGLATKKLLQNRQELMYKYNDKTFDVQKFLKDRKEMERIVSECPFAEPEQIADHFIAYTAVIWDYKMVGKIYDCYHNNIIVHREGGDDIISCESVIRDTLQLQAAFSDLRIIFHNIFCQRHEGEGGGYRFGQAVYFEGTNDGWSKFGPPTFKKLTKENCQGMCECLVQVIDGRWRIAEEWTIRSADAFDAVMKPDPVDLSSTKPVSLV
ncbi:MAG: hypothetical protein LBV27_06205 [Oscillospiraceae bacterium]|nr:hypothetical protein [Oscillospiraceae bacterium]